MSLKKYSELTKEQQEKVKVMYSDLTTVEQYLYNFDDNGDYKGRQYAPPSGKDAKVGIFGAIHAQPAGEEPSVEEKDDPKAKRTTKKK